MDEIITTFLKDYGPAGVAFAGVLWLLWRNNKRADFIISQLEVQQKACHEKIEKMYIDQLENKKTIIEDYSNLVKQSSDVTLKLTQCVGIINDTLKDLKTRS